MCTSGASNGISNWISSKYKVCNCSASCVQYHCSTLIRKHARSKIRVEGNRTLTFSLPSRCSFSSGDRHCLSTSSLRVTRALSSLARKFAHSKQMEGKRHEKGIRRLLRKRICGAEIKQRKGLWLTMLIRLRELIYFRFPKLFPRCRIFPVIGKSIFWLWVKMNKLLIAGQLVDELSILWIINTFMVVYAPVSKAYPERHKDKMWAVMTL